MRILGQVLNLLMNLTRVPPLSGAAALGTTLAIQALGSAAVIAPTAIAPPLLGALGLPTTAIGVYIASVYLGAMVASILGGHLVTSLGPIRTSQYALGLCASGLVLVCSGFVPLALLGALLIGLGYGPITPASSQILARTTPPARLGLVFSLKQTGVPLGGVLAGFATPPLALANGWASALLAVATGCVLCALLAQVLRASLDVDLLPMGRRPGLETLLRPIRMVLDEPRLRTVARCSFVFSAVQVCLTAYAVSFRTDQLEWALVAAGAALSVSQTAGVVGRVLWGWIADRGPGAQSVLFVLCATMIASGLAMALLGPDTPHALVSAALVVYGGTAIGWNGVFLAAVARLAPAGQAGMATGGTLAFTYLGVVAGPPLFGVIASSGFGYGAAFAATVVPLLACLVGLSRLQI
jgi:sugar phosphate permease